MRGMMVLVGVWRGGLHRIPLFQGVDSLLSGRAPNPRVHVRCMIVLPGSPARPFHGISTIRDWLYVYSVMGGEIDRNSGTGLARKTFEGTCSSF